MAPDALNGKRYKRIAPFAHESTAVYKTGQWSSTKPLYAEKLSPCREACPAGTDIPVALSMASEGRFDDGLKIVLQENPLPGVCGRVCYHPCQSKCNRIDFDAAVEIRSMERTFADYGSALPSRKSNNNSQRVAVIGSGPAGLSAAYFLARFGHEVTIFEGRKKPGGVLRYGIPDYRLPRSVVRKEIARILSLGITLRTNTFIDPSTLKGFMAEYDTLFLSTGAWVPRRLTGTRDTAITLLYGLDFLSSPVQRSVCADKKAIVVVGGGDVAVDVARTALRSCKGGAKVTMVAPEEFGSFPAIPEGLSEAAEEGIEMLGGYRPAGFNADDEAGRIRFTGTRVEKDPLSGDYRMFDSGREDLVLKADLVVVAIGQMSEVIYGPELFGENTGKVYVNEFGATRLTSVYAGGDLIGQRPSVVDAIASGKRAAIAIDMEAQGLERELHAVRLGGGLSLSAQAYMEGTTQVNLKRVVRFDELNTLLYRKSKPHPARYRPSDARIKNFTEISKGLIRGKAIEEAKRCFYCGRCIGCDLCFLLCPDMSIGRLAQKEYTIDVDYCKGCSICVTTCPRHVMEMGE